MASTTRRQRLTRASLADVPSRSPQKVRLDGLIKDGVWYCNCDPREEAAHLQVKKDGDNKGRYFRNCNARRCEFFLWDEDAAVRESGVSAVDIDEEEEKKGEDTANKAKATALVTPQKRQASLSRFGFRPPPLEEGVRAYDSALARASMTTDEQLEVSSLAAQASGVTRSEPATPPPASRMTYNKRKRQAPRDSDGDEFGAISSGEERDMVEAMERSSRKLALASSQTEPPSARPSTPAGQKTGGYVGNLPTPGTRDSVRGTTDASLRQMAGPGALPPATPSRVSDGGTNRRTTLSSPSLTPTLEASSPSGLVPAGLQGIDGDYEITTNVLAILNTQAMDEGAREQVRKSLNRFALQTRGIIKGRDMARSALKGKDERIAQLQERVASLENQIRTERSRSRSNHDRTA